METLAIDSGPFGSEGNAVDVQIRLFGGVAAATEDGEPVDVGPAKCQAVLAVLAADLAAFRRRPFFDCLIESLSRRQVPRDDRRGGGASKHAA